MNIQETRTTRQFVLKNDVENPAHDRRCRYGVEGLKTFKAGTVIRVVETTYTYTYDDGSSQSSTVKEYFVADKRGGISKRDAINAALAPFDPGEDEDPQSIEHAASIVGTEPDYLCKCVVEELIADGRLSYQDLVDLYDRRVSSN